MGALAGATLCTHIPRLMISDEADRKAYMQGEVSSFHAAFTALHAERIAGLDFDTFLVVDTHWFTTRDYVVNGHERLAGVYTSDELPQMFHDHAYDYRGNPALADLIAEEANARGGGKAPCSVSRHAGLAMHYGTLNPMHFLNPARDRRVLSVSVAQTAEPHNDLAFGLALGRAVARYAGRVVFVASGGLSHRFHRLDQLAAGAPPDPRHIVSPAHRAMDGAVMELMRAGRHGELLELVPSYRVACSPEGGFAHYVMMAAAHGGAAWTARGRQYGEYENAIGTGQAIFWFDAGGR